MRIVGGEFGGRRLKVPRTDAVRPTQDSVREALFSMLGAAVAGAAFISSAFGAAPFGAKQDASTPCSPSTTTLLPTGTSSPSE